MKVLCPNRLAGENQQQSTVSSQPPVRGPPQPPELLAGMFWPSRRLSVRALKASEENVTIGNQKKGDVFMEWQKV